MKMIIFDLEKKWISVKDAPPSYTDVLVTDGERIWVAQKYDGGDSYVFLASHPDYKRKPENEFGMPFSTRSQPTHWMQLPEFPQNT